MTQSQQIFDRNRVRLHRNRAARTGGDDFLLREMADRAIERLNEMNRDFPVALEIGAHTGTFARACQDKARIDTLIQADISEPMIRQAQGIRLVADEEFIPIAKGSVDLGISIGSMHWINDLPGVLVQMAQALISGGLLLVMLPGGQTLMELRQSFEKAEMEIYGGISPRISPFIDAREAAGLLQRAGLTDPVVDSEILTIQYDHPFKLLRELRNMGEVNALIHSKKTFTGCSLMMLMADIYMREHMNEFGRIPATIELVTLTAWKK